jgi:putative endonuclease
VSGQDSNRLIGQAGEAEAERFLRRKGYRILARNLRTSLGELDLVAEDGAVLVFVEVKARRTEDFGGAVEAVHERKQHKLIQVASQYLACYHLMNRACRFDVVLLQGGDGGALRVDHIQNAFELPGHDLRW